MKGKNIFTKAEIDSIRSLIEDKVQLSDSKQKSIRHKIRNIGFYWENFHPKDEIPRI